MIIEMRPVEGTEQGEKEKKFSLTIDGNTSVVGRTELRIRINNLITSL